MSGLLDYELFGVRVRSELALGRQGASTPAEPDLELTLARPAPVGADVPEGEVLVEFVLDGRPVYTAADDGERLTLRLHGLCDFELESSLGRARCRPDPAAHSETLALVARGAFLAFWLGRKGHCVLHASAVERRGRAIAFVGGSGGGKSTLAAWACAAGATFVADDLLRLDDAPRPTWVGRAPELRLRGGAADLVLGREGRWAPRASADGRVAVTPPAPTAHRGPLAAAVLPNPVRGATGLELSVLDPVDAVLALSAFPRLEGWRWGPAQEAQLDGASRLAGAIPVVIAGVPWGPPFDPAVIEELLLVGERQEATT